MIRLCAKKLTSPLLVGQLLLLLLTTYSDLFAQGKSTQQLDKDSIALSYDIEDVVVTAQYAPTDSKSAIQHIRTIDRLTIDRQGANNLEQLLQQDLNIRISQDQILGSSMSLLGIGGENVKIMIDGIPVVGRLNGNIDLSQINLQNIERIEIVEGPMSVSYGTDALGGVINLITKKSQLPTVEASILQQLETKAESGTTMQAGIRLAEQWLVQVNGGHDWFNGLGEAGARSDLWNPKEQWYFDGSLRRNFGVDHRIIYRFSHFDEAVQNLGNVRRPQFQPYAFDDYFNTQRTDHALLHEGTVWKQFYWQNVLGYNQFNREVSSYRTDLESEAQSLIAGQGDTTVFNTITARSILASRFRDSKVNAQLGVDIKHETGSGARIVDPESAQLGESFIYDLAVFGSLRYQPWEALSLESGLRLAYNSRYQAPLIPSLHAKYQLTDALSLRASYGKGFRSPSLKELFMSFIDINHFIIGNPDLRAETSDNFQLNLAYQTEWKARKLSARLNVFHNQIQDQIQLFPFVERDGTLQPATNTASTEYAYFNLEEAITQGVSSQISYQWQGLTVEGGLSFIGFNNPLSETNPEVAPFSYATELSGKLAYQLTKTGTQLTLFARANDRLITYYPAMEDGQEVARQRSQDGFTLFDGSIAQSFFKDRLSLTAGVRNILDITQININGGGGGAHSGGPNLPVSAGRSIFVRANFNIVCND